LIRSMCRLIETIKISDGHAENISWHNLRFNQTRYDLFGIHNPTDLGKLIHVPEEFSKGEVKCRISYWEEIDLIEFEPYLFRPIATLKIVSDDFIIYDYKYLDRSDLNRLFCQKGEKDDILIVKNGLIRECSYSNVVMWDGKEFFTPDSPLLKGTKRAKYISEGIIKERSISVKDIDQYQEVHLINAFLDIGRCVVLTKDVI
jgi:4-amino-4-deoxychorismate lyase